MFSQKEKRPPVRRELHTSCTALARSSSGNARTKNAVAEGEVHFAGGLVRVRKIKLHSLELCKRRPISSEGAETSKPRTVALLYCSTRKRVPVPVNRNHSQGCAGGVHRVLSTDGRATPRGLGQSNPWSLLRPKSPSEGFVGSSRRNRRMWSGWTVAVGSSSVHPPEQTDKETRQHRLETKRSQRCARHYQPHRMRIIEVAEVRQAPLIDRQT